MTRAARSREGSEARFRVDSAEPSDELVGANLPPLTREHPVAGWPRLSLGYASGLSAKTPELCEEATPPGTP